MATITVCLKSPLLPFRAGGGQYGLAAAAVCHHIRHHDPSVRLLRTPKLAGDPSPVFSAPAAGFTRLP
jgi:hypothetical protein